MVPVGTELVGVAKATASGFQLLGRLGKWISDRKETVRLARSSQQLLGFASEDLYSYRVALHHPLYRRGDPHPDDLAAFVTVAGHAIARAEEKGSLTFLDDIKVRLVDGLVLIGSPEAEALTRLVFGYECKPNDGGMRYRGTSIDLPYRWEEDRAKVSASCGKFVPGIGRVDRPNWPIIDQRGASYRPIYPIISNQGLLHTDLLLITKVPNFLTAEGYESGRSIVSVAGAHGTATRSVEFLLRDRELLRQIAEAVPQACQSFQILLEAGDIKHDLRQGTRATKLTLRDVRVFERPHKTWRAAMRQVAVRYDKWYSEVSSG
jgi:hypothetical protein